MPLIDTLNAIQWWNSSTNPWAQSTDTDKAVTDFNEGEQGQINSYITSLYASGTAASTMEQARGILTTIRIGKSVDPLEPAFVAQGSTGQYYLGFNNTEVAKIWYFNTSGTLVAEIPMLTLIHEFSHVIGKSDPTGVSGGRPTETEENSADWDFEGSALRLQNEVARELSQLNNIQASYYAALGGSDARKSSFTLGENYTENETIKIVRIGDSMANNLDMSSRTDDSRDLLFGLGGDDTLKGGGGRDFIYGGDGKDKIWGGEGNDLLVGDEDDDEFRGEKGDDIIWGGAKFFDFGRTDGIDSVFYDTAAASVTFRLSGTTTAAMTVQDGDGGTDTLHSIEIIQGSGHGDTLVVQSLTPEIGSAFDYIDLGAGADTIDLSGLSGSFTLDLSNPALQTLTMGGAVLNLRNIEHFTGSGAGHIVHSSTVSSGIYDSGGGNDVIYLAGSGHTILAGGGFDVLNNSSVITGSRIDIGSGTALVRGSGTSSFDSIEEVVGGGGSNLMYGDGRGTTLVGGAGVNYLEGSGADVLRSGSGDTYFSVSDCATVISGAGNDYIEVSGPDPVTIVFGVGSGHDMLASHFRPDEDWAAARKDDMIVFEGLSGSDIELVWEFVHDEHDATDLLYGKDTFSRSGEAAIRIISTGETLYLGTLLFFHDRTSGEGFILLERMYTDDGAYDEFLESPFYSHDRLEGNTYINTFDFKIFSFDGTTRLNLFDLFDFVNATASSLPPEAKLAEDVLARLGDGSGSGLQAGTPGSDEIVGSAGNDDILAGTGNDTLNGGSGDDFLRGGGGNDQIVGGAGNDNIDGGGGDDVVSYSLATSGVTVSLGTITPQNTGGDGIDTLINVENLIGSAFNDTLSGDSGSNQIEGGAGDDVISGGANGDFLIGGSGADTFHDAAADFDGDTIADFSFGDRIVVSDATISSFDFSLDGTTLNFTGGSLTLGSVPNGRIVAREASGGGVELRLVPRIGLNNGSTDFNGDGRDDILWRSEGNGLSDWLGIASGGYVINDVNAYTMVPGSWHIAGTGDFNGDGRDDILWRSDTGILSNWLGLANGGFTINDANALIGVPNDWQVVATGDFNGDGRDDILWRSDIGTVTNWLGTGSGGLTNNDSNAMAGVPVDWQIVGVGDFNGDGRDDILWRSDSGILSNWLGTPAGGFANNDANALTNVSNWMQVVGTGDFNGDGRDDILWRDDWGAVFTWLGTPSGGFTNNSANSSRDMSLDWHVAGTGDYNGDGRDDILWRNDSGELINWLGTPTGGFTPNEANSYSDVPTNWHVQSPDLIVA